MRMPGVPGDLVDHDNLTSPGVSSPGVGLVAACNASEPWGPWKTALVVALSSCSFVTTIGNLLVILAFIAEKKLRTNFNLFLLNLAITDLLVSVSATPLYTIDYAMCRWPFDEIACGVWIFMDWGMTFASIFTLVAISVDRYWAACWSTHYRNNNSRRRTVGVIVVTWVVLFLVWVPPFILDRVRWSKPGKCIWEIDKNRIFSIIVSLLGYHGPSILILLFYIKVVHTMYKLSKSMAKKRAQSLAITGRTLDVISSSESSTSRVRSNTIISNPQTQAIRMEPDPVSEAISSVSGSVTEGSVAAPYMVRKRSKKRVRISTRERKIFASLSVVVIAYLICWLPWHIVFDLVYFRPDLVSNEWYTFAALMTYVNSAVNPILYAFANQDFRAAFRKLLTCQYFRSKSQEKCLKK